MGCCQSTRNAKEEEEEEHAEQQIDIRFSATSADGTERDTQSTVRQSQPRTSVDLVGPAALTGRYGSSRGAPSPSLSSVSLVPVARTGSYDVRVASRTRQNGGDGVIETSRLVVDHLKGNVFINQYLIIKDLGKGAHGTVKLVYNTQDDMLYAMKVIHKRRMRRQSYLAEPRAVANMMRNVGMTPMSQSQTEGQRGPSPLASPRAPNGMTDEYSNEIAVMKELDHPNVVKLYEVIHDPSNNKLLMTMEYVEGGCVLAGSSPTQKVPIPETTAVKYFRDVVKGLEYLHFNRIVHGDLKPDNLLMSSSGKVKISDFGSARFCEKSDMIFATAGTPSFMAPEMCQGKQFNGFPGDIWALGVCLFMFIFGKPPFTGATTYQIYEAIQRGELVFPPEIPASADLRDLLSMLLQKDPAMRLSLEEIPAHPWVTRGGALPVLQTSNERAVQRVFEAMRKRNESGAKRPAPSTVPLAAPPEPVDMRKLVPDAEVRTFRDGEVIITQGQLPEGLYYVQQGFIDMMLMPSEKKLVADEDFADAIDDEDDEEDEAVVTATAHALDNRRSPGSAIMGPDGDDGSGGDMAADDTIGEGEEEGEEDGEEEKGMDGFMALFGVRLSDRVSPLGTSPMVTPRNQSAVTPRHGSQTLLARNHSAASVVPRYASQSLGLQRVSNAQYDSPGRGGFPYTAVSNSMPLPPALNPHPHLSMPGASNSPHQQSGRVQSLSRGGAAAPLPISSSRSQSQQLPSRTASQTYGTPLARSPTGASAVASSGAPLPRSDSAAPSAGTSGGGSAAAVPLPPPPLPPQPSLHSAAAPGHGHLSFSGGAGQLRTPSYSGGSGAAGALGASISPSPLGLSCSNAADILDDESTGREGPARGPAVVSRGPSMRGGLAALVSQRPASGVRGEAQAQPPSFVPSPHVSPQGSRRALIQEPSFNTRLPSRHEVQLRQPSRLSLTDSNTSLHVPTAPPARAAMLGRAASNRVRQPREPEDAGVPQPDNGGTSSAGPSGMLGPTTSRKMGSARGLAGGLGGVLPAFFGSQPQITSLSPAAHADGGGGKNKQHQQLEDDLLFLSPMESRRLSVTAGGTASFRRLGGAGIVVGASPPSGPPGAVSPAGSISRMQSTDYSARPAGIPPAMEEAIAEANGSGKAVSHDSINSNADISMHAANKGGWRRERPSPLQVTNSIGGGGLSGGGGLEPVGSGGVEGGSGPVFAVTPGTESPRPIPQSKSLKKLRSAMRRSATHSNIIIQPSGGAVMQSGGGPAEGHDAARCEGDDDVEDDGDGTQGGSGALRCSSIHQQPSLSGRGSEGQVQVRHAMTDVDRVQPDTSQGGAGYMREPLATSLPSPCDRGRVRRHSTSSYTAGYMLNRILGVSTGGAQLDRSSIQEWSTTSKLAQKAIQRSDSMHSRMAQMVLRAKQHAVRRKRRGSMQLITTRGPGSVVGELCIDGKPAPSPSTVVAKGPVTVLLIKNEKVNKYRNQPSVMAALHRSQNASMVQEAMERFVECEQEVVAVEVIRRTITTEPNLHLGAEMTEEDYPGDHHSSERLMADIYNG